LEKEFQRIAGRSEVAFGPVDMSGDMKGAMLVLVVAVSIPIAAFWWAFL
jgi:hypothetical protein